MDRQPQVTMLQRTRQTGLTRRFVSDMTSAACERVSGDGGRRGGEHAAPTAAVVVAVVVESREQGFHVRPCLSELTAFPMCRKRLLGGNGEGFLLRRKLLHGLMDRCRQSESNCIGS